MSARPPARVVLVQPRLVPDSLVAHAEALAGCDVEWTERRGPAGHVLVGHAPAADAERLRAELRGPAIALGTDVAVVDGPLLDGVGLVVCDADSTFFVGEVIDELAHRHGSGAEVAEVTAAAMAGELDFAQSLAARVATLAGLEAAALDEVSAAMTPSPGALELLARVHAAGARLGIVSGGFLPVLAPLQEALGFDHLAANGLEIADGRLTGRVRGPVVDRAAKERHLRAWADADGLPLERTAAAGDGANDVDMIAAAGLGVAYAAKPRTAQLADSVIASPRLDVLAEFLDLPPL